jgi:uncharacterized RDD family membrane protein YckC
LSEEYEGLVTRAIAFAIDAAIISAVAVVVGAAVGISLSVLSVPSEVETVLFALGGGACLLWSMGYFLTFWCTTGQTPGNRVLGFRVCRAEDGLPLRPARALLRLIALAACAIPLFAGFLPVLFDARRRGVHDMVAGTVVVGATVGSDPAPAAVLSGHDPATRVPMPRDRERGGREQPAHQDQQA